MKFIITNFDGFRNKGCEASLKVIVNEITKLDKDANFKIFSRDPEYDTLLMNRNKNVDFLATPSAGSFPFSRREFSRPWQQRVIGKLGLSKSIKEGMKAFQWADAALVTGGDVFSSTYSGFSLRLSPVEVASSFGKPQILVGHSIGPFEKEKEYKAFTKSMKRVRLITARETLSLRYLESMKLKNTKIELTAEPAFCLKPDVKNLKRLLRMYNIPDKKLVAIAPSQAISKYSGISYDNHFKAVHKLVQILTKEFDCHVILLPHVHENSVEYDDRVICELLYRKLGFPENVTVISLTHSAEEIRGLVSTLDLLIVERMHAAIAGLSENVPTFVIGYNAKAGGILSDIFGPDSLEKYMISVRNLHEEILKKRVENLLDNRSWVVNHLSKMIPRIKKNAERNFTLIMETLRTNNSRKL